MLKDKNYIANPFSTGDGGGHFENNVQTAFVILMLTGGFAPCLPNFQITKIKLQGKYQGYESDDLIVHTKDSQTNRETKLLCQIKHSIRIMKSDEPFVKSLRAAWRDFNNSKIFSAEAGDRIAILSGPLSSTDNRSIIPLLELARHSEDEKDFNLKINQRNFTSEFQRTKLKVIEDIIKNENTNKHLSESTLYQFLKSFYILTFDLDINGFSLSLLFSLIEKHSKENSFSIFSQINQYVQRANERAGTLTFSDFPEELRNHFKQPIVQTIPNEYIKDSSVFFIKDWNKHPNANELAIACLIGSWNESVTGDKEIVSRMANAQYDQWILKLRDLIQYPDCPLRFNNGVWYIKDRKKIFNLFSNRIFDRDLDILKENAISVLCVYDPKFELPKDDRFSARLFGKRLIYSNEIIKGIAETLAVLSNSSESLKHCSIGKAEVMATLVIRKVFDKENWMVWATLNDILPILAEAAPDEFLKLVDNTLSKNKNPIDELFLQEGNSVGGWNYITGLLWALETLAWDEEYLISVTNTLCELASRDPGGNWANRPSRSLTMIYLPWYLQTLASFDKRKIAIENITRDFPEIAWKLLLTLLPNQHQMSMGCRKPTYREPISENFKVEISNAEYWNQIEYYSGLAVQLAECNIDRLNQLIQNLDNLPQSSFDALLFHLSSEKIASLNDDIKLKLWLNLMEFTSRHKLYSDCDWALPNEIIEKIDKVVSLLEPNKLIDKYSRLFSDNDIDLYEKKGDWEGQRKILEQKQKKALNEIIVKDGVDSIFELLQIVESSSKVGQVLGFIGSDEYDERFIPQFVSGINGNFDGFFNAYIWSRYYMRGWVWADTIIASIKNKLELSKFLLALPFITETWDRVTTNLDELEDLYWGKVWVNPYITKNGLSFAINKLLKHSRPLAALDCIHKEIHEKNTIDTEIVIKCLSSALTTKENKRFDIYHIIEIIKFLQISNSINIEDMYGIEWAYLKILERHNGAEPKFLWNRLSKEPEFFCEIIKLSYRSKNEVDENKKNNENDSVIVSNAWDLLHHWHLIPGLDANGIFNKEIYSLWFQKVKENTDESGHLEIAYYQIGSTFFYSPPDKDGFWIDREIANILNQIDVEEMRNGYSTESFNSRGVHWVDPTGKPEFEFAETYRKKAVETENAGYVRFANTLKMIASRYEDDGKRIAQSHKKEIDNE